MGEVATKICGGSNALDILLKTYGDDIGKFIAIQKTKQFIDGKIDTLKQTVGQQTNNVQQQVLGSIDSKKIELGNQFENYKQMINQKVPGGISSVEKLKGQSIQNMLGYNDFMKKFEQLKVTTTNKFNEQQKNVFNTIDQTGQKQKQVLDTQKPKVPLYDDLSENQQKIVFKEGQKMFAKQIQEHQDKIIKQIGDKLNPQNYLGKFKNLVPMGSLDGILGSATTKFQSVKKMLTAGGNLGSLTQGLGGIF